MVEDPNYVPLLEDPSEPEYEWRPVTEPEHEMVREIAADLRRKAMLRLTCSTASTRRHPICFPLILYYDATLPMLD